MKAREIKKSLIRERDSEIEEYNTQLKHRATETDASVVKIRQLNHILLKYFNVETKYIDTISLPIQVKINKDSEPLSGIERASEPEVDDVPF